MSTAILLMAHGTPSSLDDLPEYLTRVRGGRPASEELAAEIRRNYAAIGGRSPLTDITFRQRDALATRLGGGVPVVVGMRFWHPYIADAILGLDNSGVTRIVGIPLAPQFSTLSVSRYVDDASLALPPGVTLDCVTSFHAHPRLLGAFAARIREVGGPAPGERVVFTAHALPERVVASGDPYVDEVRATAAGVARMAGIDGYDVAFQSAGRTPEPWIGPELNATIRERAAAGVRGVLVVPVGFVSDHTEILFDLDVQAAATASACGVQFRRTPSLNDSVEFISLLEELVQERL
jgi:protoporphyrin/coproporphyrin ferrochelatase